ncbi:MAG: CsiV family protein, partial [Luminiphilus sp.]
VGRGMQKQLTKQALVSLLASLLATAAISQERGAAMATVPEYSDEPSGWVRVEVAIFADSNAATLNAETWEHAPTLRYPESRRWLTRYDEIKALMDEWGESAVTVNADGSIDVVPEPIIEPVIEAAQETSEPLIDSELEGESLEATMGNASLQVSDDSGINVDSLLGIDEAETLTDGDTSPSAEIDGSDLAQLVEPLPQDALELSNNPDDDPNSAPAAPIAGGTQVSMEELLTEVDTDSIADSALAEESVADDATVAVSTEGLDDNVDTAAIDAVDIFNTGDMTDASAPFGSMTGGFPDNSSIPGSDINWLDGYAIDEENAEDTDTIAPEEAPPALPTPYQALAVEMLKQGLDKLQQQADRAPVTAVAWLQGPGDDGTPIVLDAWQEASDFPIVQGTLTFARDEQAFVAVDLWLNTSGDYLPPRFEAIETPSAPKRVLVIETPPTEQEPALEAEAPQFIDLRTGLNTDGSVSKVDESGATSESAEQTSSPYRHAIAVSEQRDIREGYVRYIDHPTLQVVATWRELSFKEVYELGESQRIRRDIDSLTRTLTAAPNTTGLTPGSPRPQTAPESMDSSAP